ncbi:acetylxylan esterase [bacterium]|nr:acetylxylan esterase [candidate division CSSED10-310 bacterium]
MNPYKSVLPFLKRKRDAIRIRRRVNLAEAHLVRVAERLSTSSIISENSLAGWSRKREEITAKLSWMLNLSRPYESVLPAVENQGTIEESHFTIQKLVFQTLPNVFVTTNLYLPRKSIYECQDRPCILYMCGHWPSRDGAKTGFQDRYLWYPANGFALMVIDPMGFGEIPGIHAGTNRLGWWSWASLGYTPAGLEVYNAMRILDWLLQQPGIDPKRVGATGISGGGVISQYLAAMDERVTVVVPSCSTFTIGSQIQTRRVQHQCDCTYYTNTCEIDFPEILALIAPRPLLILGGRNDPIFPPAGYREAYRSLLPIYELYNSTSGNQHQIQLIESPGGHEDTPELLDAARKWMLQWLKVESDIDSINESPQPLPPEKLRCLSQFPDTAINDRVHDYWIQRPALDPPISKTEWIEKSERLHSLLKHRVFRKPFVGNDAFNTRRYKTSGGYSEKLAVFGEFEFDSVKGVPIRVRLLTPARMTEHTKLIIGIKKASDHESALIYDEYLAFLHSHAVMIVTPRFADIPLSGSQYERIERSALLLGSSIAVMQVWDIRRSIEWIQRDRCLNFTGITLYATDEACVPGLYAAVLDHRIDHLVLRNPPISHFDSSPVPTILRDTDIPEIAGLMAPRLLSIIGRKKLALTETIFTIFDKPDSFGYFSSLSDAVFSRESMQQ